MIACSERLTCASNVLLDAHLAFAAPEMRPLPELVSGLDVDLGLLQAGAFCRCLCLHIVGYPTLAVLEAGAIPMSDVASGSLTLGSLTVSTALASASQWWSCVAAPLHRSTFMDGTLLHNMLTGLAGIARQEKGAPFLLYRIAVTALTAHQTEVSDREVADGLRQAAHAFRPGFVRRCMVAGVEARSMPFVLTKRPGGRALLDLIPTLLLIRGKRSPLDSPPDTLAPRTADRHIENRVVVGGGEALLFLQDQCPCPLNAIFGLPS